MTTATKTKSSYYGYFENTAGDRVSPIYLIKTAHDFDGLESPNEYEQWVFITKQEWMAGDFPLMECA